MVLKVSPQAGDEFRSDDVAGVLGDETDEEKAVSTEICPYEPVDFLRLLRLVADGLHRDESGFDVAHLGRHDEGRAQPHDETSGGCDGDKGEPEPEEDEDLLVEEVHGQRALHRVAVDVAQLAYLEVAERDAREPVGRRPRLAAQHAREHVEAVPRVVHAEEDVQQEDLHDDIGDVHELDEDVQHDQVVAVDAPQEALAARRRHDLVAAHLEQEASHVLRHVADGLVATVGVRLALALDGGVRDGADGDAGLLAEEPPNRPRQVEEDGLAGEDE